MKSDLMRFVIGAALVLSFVGAVEAKRAAPPNVTPLVSNGVRYTAQHEQVRQKNRPAAFRASIEAREVSTNQVLWSAEVYRINYAPKRETDVQDEWISRLQISQGRLIVTTERGRRFNLDVRTGKVTNDE